MNAGTLPSIRELTVTFRYNDPESLAALFRQYPDQIACVMLEPVKYNEPQDNFLHRVRELAHAHGALFILDEMITGFRWHTAGAQAEYGVEPDLCCFGKAMANGFAVSALVGKREYMEVAGLYHDRERVFLLSTTHGAETHALAAAMATIDFYRHEPVIETFREQGSKLANGIRRLIDRHQLQGYVDVIGRPCNLVFTTADHQGRPSQAFRTLLMQELIQRGVLAPSLVISYSHSDADLEQTIRAFDGALSVYRDAITHGLDRHLQGRATQVVYRKYNDTPYCAPPRMSLQVPTKFDASQNARAS
jgi:glutamate-1-semialdehyde 2,1-aminomutase